MSNPPDGMHPTTWQALRALRAGARLSRNRHFYLFKDPRVQRAVKLHRYLESVARDVEAHAEHIEVSVVGEGDRCSLRIDFPLIHGRRTAYLSAAELALLAERAPHVARLIADELDGDAEDQAAE